VPLQSALVPVLTRSLAAGDAAGLRRLVLRICAGIGATAAVAALLGFAAGPAATTLLFGARYALDRADLALLAVGAALHLGLLVLTQVLVATGRHRAVALVWLMGLAAAALLFAVGPSLVTAAGSAFTGGSGVALGAAVLLLLRTGSRAALGASREEGHSDRAG
jgi:O-antigen/teichoic acid export membrane protein